MKKEYFFGIMKRIVIFLFCILLILQTSCLFGLGSLSSTHYLRTLNRFASVGTTDTVIFNPSGILALDDGIYLNINGGLPVQLLAVDHPIHQSVDPKNKPPFRTSFGLSLPLLSFVYKYPKKNFFLAGVPTRNEGITFSNLMMRVAGWNEVISTTTSGSTLRIASLGYTNYRIDSMAYELRGGTAFSLGEGLTMSVGAGLLSDLETRSSSFYKTDYKKQADYSALDLIIGLTGYVGLSHVLPSVPWISYSINVGTGGLGFAWRPQGFPEFFQGYYHDHGGPYSIEYFPANADLGMAFTIEGLAIVQVTANVELAPLRSMKKGMSFQFKQGIYYGYGAGVGIDFTLLKSIIFGCGILYKSRTRLSADRDSFFDEVLDLKLNSISAGTGISFDLGSTLSLGISMMYPVYFSLSNGLSFGKKEFLLQYVNATINKKLRSDIFVSDIIIGIGVTMNLGKPGRL